MKRRTGYILALWLCICGNGLMAQYCARIPYAYSGGKMMVQVEIAGKTGNFIFDTGAPVCLTHTFARTLELETVGQVQTQDANGRVADSPIVGIGSLRVGGVNFTGVQGVTLEEGNMVEQFGVDGIIGYTLFGDKIVEIDTRKQCITIAGEEKFFDLDAGRAVPILPGNPIPLFEVKLNGQAVDTVMLDSGAGGFYDLSEKTYRRLQDSGAWTLLSRGYGILSLAAGGLEQRALKYKVKIPLFTVGKEQFANVVTKTTSGRDSRLGAEFLRSGIVTVDYRKGLLYYRAYGEGVKNREEKDWNVVITVMDNELKAGFVWESMWPELKGGEKIVEVNGKRFDKVDAWKAMTTGLVGLSGEQAEIVVVGQDGREKKLTIRRE